jgi:hypothetical protein
LLFPDDMRIKSGEFQRDFISNMLLIRILRARLHADDSHHSAVLMFQ